MARIRNNALLDRVTQPYLPACLVCRSVYHARGTPCHELRYYQADSWKHLLRVVRSSFCLIANLTRDRYSGVQLLRLYHMRARRGATWGTSWTRWLLDASSA